MVGNVLEHPVGHVLATGFHLLHFEIDVWQIAAPLIVLQVVLFHFYHGEYLRHLALSDRAECSDQLIHHRVFMEHSPERGVEVCGKHHALTDYRLALLLIVVVFDNIQHTIEEYVGGLNLPDGFQNLLPSLLSCLCVAQPKDEEMFLGFLFVDA